MTASVATLPGPTLPGPTLPGPTLPGPTLPGPTLPGPTLPGPTLPGPTLPGPTLPGPTLPGPTLPGPTPPAAGSPPAVLRPRRLPSPATEPPFDEHPAVPRVTAILPSQAIQGTLALNFTLPSGVSAQPRTALRLVPDPTDEPASGLPPVDDWSHTIAIAIAQILSGERSAAQFLHWASPDVLARLGRRAAVAAAVGGTRRRAVLRSVRVCCPALGVAEVSTVVHGLVRPRALAFRLEARRSRWVCTALDIG